MRRGKSREIKRKCRERKKKGNKRKTIRLSRKNEEHYSTTHAHPRSHPSKQAGGPAAHMCGHLYNTRESKVKINLTTA